MTGLWVLLTIAVIVQGFGLAFLYRRVTDLEARPQPQPGIPSPPPEPTADASTEPRTDSRSVISMEAPPIETTPPPVRSFTEPPVKRRGQSVTAWAESRRQEVLIEAILDEWTEACVGASEVGWVVGIPTGDTLLSAWARAMGGVDIAEPSVSFATWFVTEIGKGTRRGLTSRMGVEQRDAASRRLLLAARRLLKGLSEELILDVKAPLGVGPKHRHEWLVDEAIAAAIGNAIVADVVRPLVVLRPLLMRGEVVLLEGEVA